MEQQYTEFSKKDKLFIRFICLIFILITSIFITIDVHSLLKTNSKTYSINTTNELRMVRSKSGTDSQYIPTYHYIVNGKEYGCTVKISSNLEASQKPKLVRYAKNTPYECYVFDFRKLLFYAPFLICLLILFSTFKSKENN